MPVSADQNSAAAKRAASAALVAHLEASGYPLYEPPILQKAALFFNSGEDIRSRLYLTSDLSGAEYCLRPEYTIPVSQHYLASDVAGRAATYSYCGPVFRYRTDGPNEFLQAGIENFGHPDREAADAEILGVTLDAVAALGQINLDVRFGDNGLIRDLVAALDLSPQWQRRILRGHAQDKSLDAILAQPANGKARDHTGVLAALQGADKQGARALVEDLLSIAGISSVGGRSAAEIAERFLEQAALKSGQDFPDEARAILNEFLSIETDPDQASARLRQIAAMTGVDLNAALDRFDARLGFMAARGLDVADFTFSTRFARDLEYYTGFVFEAFERGRPRNEPIVGGGRFDGLLKSLGGEADIGAVGAAIWIERLKLPERGQTDWWR
ncbi:ATP phosphoribosyltransferase regulatory subunit [Methylovirgula ligni]|uniref:ATP phosphoribosyltransferase regulatory subunit n=1 Tax=Methylovirgula ligni TaxID=569860 RepID=A0A3D9Z6N9_9HYPH|nr:ATP phosphoribosyltransferase regulatory subunit [Methylovirgula ligni]QAY95472.1 ATP phosphoribosyltransferase regulatory subunit [Methylovirgula ligni]REF89199.1 ATP phosphoribosyltransferase regulatory subunit [Methylovirgula ligni]